MTGNEGEDENSCPEMVIHPRVRRKIKKYIYGACVTGRTARRFFVYALFPDSVVLRPKQTLKRWSAPLERCETFGVVLVFLLQLLREHVLLFNLSHPHPNEPKIDTRNGESLPINSLRRVCRVGCSCTVPSCQEQYLILSYIKVYLIRTSNWNVMLDMRPISILNFQTSWLFMLETVIRRLEWLSDESHVNKEPQRLKTKSKQTPSRKR